MWRSKSGRRTRSYKRRREEIRTALRIVAGLGSHRSRDQPGGGQVRRRRCTSVALRGAQVHVTGFVVLAFLLFLGSGSGLKRKLGSRERRGEGGGLLRTRRGRLRILGLAVGDLAYRGQSGTRLAVSDYAHRRRFGRAPLGRGPGYGAVIGVTVTFCGVYLGRRQ